MVVRNPRYCLLLRLCFSWFARHQHVVNINNVSAVVISGRRFEIVLQNNSCTHNFSSSVTRVLNSGGTVLALEKGMSS